MINFLYIMYGFMQSCVGFILKFWGHMVLTQTQNIFCEKQSCTKYENLI